MPRKIIVRTKDGFEPLLMETLAANELELQELMKENPDLLPVEDFELTGPLLVIGRETSVPSGAIDLLCMARSGDLLIIEFKTGPQNTDFRHAIAQLLDYGAQIWGMDYAEFESAVAVRYFNSPLCRHPLTMGKDSIEAAAVNFWGDQSAPMTEDEWLATRERLSSQLVSGSFHYLLVAQRFTARIQRVIDYMNAVVPDSKFYSVELVRFTNSAIDAYESRTLSRPQPAKPRPSGVTSESRLLSAIDDESYRSALTEFFEAGRGFTYRFEWGSLGGSIRLPTPFRTEPVTIAWVFPPGKVGWMGLTDVTLGFDSWSSDQAPGSGPFLEAYVRKALQLSGAELVRAKSVRGAHFKPEVFVLCLNDLSSILGDLIREVNGAPIAG